LRSTGHFAAIQAISEQPGPFAVATSNQTCPLRVAFDGKPQFNLVGSWANLLNLTCWGFGPAQNPEPRTQGLETAVKPGRNDRFRSIGAVCCDTGISMSCSCAVWRALPYLFIYFYFPPDGACAPMGVKNREANKFPCSRIQRYTDTKTQTKAAKRGIRAVHSLQL